MVYLKDVPVGVLLTLSICLTILGDYFAKKRSIFPNTRLYLLTMGFWMIANFFFIPALLKKTLITNGLIFTLGNIMGFTLVGWLLFKESLSSSGIAGLILGTIALVLLVIEH